MVFARGICVKCVVDTINCFTAVYFILMAVDESPRIKNPMPENLVSQTLEKHIFFDILQMEVFK